MIGRIAVVVTAGAIILILLSSILTNVAYAQIFPNAQVNPTATPTPSPQSGQSAEFTFSKNYLTC